MPEQVYNVIYSQEEKGEYNPFVDPSRMEVKQVTEAELRDMWDNFTHTKDVFGTFENYLAYTAEASDYLANTSWWDAEGIDTRTRAETLRDEDDLSRTPGQTVADQLVQSDLNARQSGYQQWLMSDINQALMSKYGVDPTITNDKGDKFTWTGSGYIRTYEAEEGFDFADFAKGAIVAAITGGLATGLAPALASSLGVSQGLAQSILNFGLSAAAEGDISLNNALALGFNTLVPGSGELGDINEAVANSVFNSVQDYVLNPDNYSQENGETVWDERTIGTITGDIVGEIEATVPYYDYTLDREEAGGGGGDAEEVSQEELMGAEDPFGDTTATPPEAEQPRYVYNGNGTWTDTVTGETIYGPGEEGDAVSDEEMADMWETGRYTWEIIDDVSQQSPEQQAEPAEEETIDVDVIVPTDTVTTPTDTTTTGTETGGDTGTGTGEGGGDGTGTGTGTGTGFGTGIGGGTGDGTGDGDGDGDGGRRPIEEPQGMMAQTSFQPFYSGISYQAPTIQQIVQNPATDYTASLNDLINRNSGMFG